MANTKLLAEETGPDDSGRKSWTFRLCNRESDIRRTVKETDNWRIPNKTGLGDTLVKRKIKVTSHWRKPVESHEQGRKFRAKKKVLETHIWRKPVQTKGFFLKRIPGKSFEVRKTIVKTKYVWKVPLGYEKQSKPGSKRTDKLWVGGRKEVKWTMGHMEVRKSRGHLNMARLKPAKKAHQSSEEAQSGLKPILKKTPKKRKRKKKSGAKYRIMQGKKTKNATYKWKKIKDAEKDAEEKKKADEKKKRREKKKKKAEKKKKRKKWRRLIPFFGRKKKEDSDDDEGDSEDSDDDDEETTPIKVKRRVKVVERWKVPVKRIPEKPEPFWRWPRKNNSKLAEQSFWRNTNIRIEKLNIWKEKNKEKRRVRFSSKTKNQ